MNEYLLRMAVTQPRYYGACFTCGHPWRVHARPDHIGADVDNGERWCYQDDCRCRRFTAPPEGKQVGDQ